MLLTPVRHSIDRIADLLFLSANTAYSRTAHDLNGLFFVLVRDVSDVLGDDESSLLGGDEILSDAWERLVELG